MWAAHFVREMSEGLCLACCMPLEWYIMFSTWVKTTSLPRAGFIGKTSHTQRIKTVITNWSLALILCTYAIQFFEASLLLLDSYYYIICHIEFSWYMELICCPLVQFVLCLREFAVRPRVIFFATCKHVTHRNKQAVQWILHKAVNMAEGQAEEMFGDEDPVRNFHTRKILDRLHFW